MTIALLVLAALTAIELLLWRWRTVAGSRPVAAVLAVVIPLGSVALPATHPALWTGMIAWFGLYRGFNLWRFRARRLQAVYLNHASMRTGLSLIAVQLVIGISVAASHALPVPTVTRWFLLLACQLSAAAVLLLSTVRHLRTTRPVAVRKSYVDNDLPTLTVAIPARNETAELEECLTTLVRSTYPKLEVLVLDDCSVVKRTPEIIRSFAHDGVRFIAGTEPAEHWLAKNWAYSQLAAEANGELLLFCGVDARFEPDSLRQLVILMLEKHKTMVSLIPKNRRPRGYRMLFVQPARYAWELSLPRRLFKRPPVLSTCWMIERETLKAAGGFESVSNSISPESYLARQAALTDGYSFMQSDDDLGVISVKTFGEQRDTAIRCRYPQLHRRPELVALLALAEAAALVLPFVMLLIMVARGAWLLAGLYALTCLILTVFYGLVVRLTYRRVVLSSIWLLPATALFDLWLLNYSMWQYEFGEVVWKGRNVCIPVMQAIPHLPSL